MAQPLVLIVEDETDIAELIEFNLERSGFRTRTSLSGEDAIEQIERELPDLVMLDIMLPGVDGLEVCRRLKQSARTAHVPIIMVSARGEEADVVVGLELGADDYITKPFSPRVLLARVGAVLRRRDQREKGTSRISLADGALVIDADRHTVLLHDETLSLTLTEYRLLLFLAQRPGFVRTREQIVTAVRGEGTVLSSRAIDVHVASLRQKLGPMAALIETVRGVGYRLAESTEAAVG